MRCLLLDAAMRPMTLVSRERAVSLVVCGNAQVIAEEPSVVYRSEHLSVALPVIVQVPAYVELRPIVRRNVVRRVLFCRDNWRCAYCEIPDLSFGNAPRSVLRGPGVVTTDLTLEKSIGLKGPVKLDLRAEAFNLLNRANFNIPGLTLGAPDFGVISSARPARAIQLGARLSF